MKTIIATAGLAVLMLLTSGCNQLRSRYQMNQGIQAYKNHQYNSAVTHFQEAVNLDPQNVNGRLYLATSYMIQYVPGSTGASNLRNAARARAGFMDVLKQNANDEMALDSLASLCLQEANSADGDEKTKKLDESKNWFDKVIQVNSKNRDAYYSLGVIDWLKWYPNLMAAKATIGMKPEDPGPIKDKKIRAELVEKYSPIIEDGIKNLKTALEKDPNYGDAMAYLNLLHRERADLADSQEQYKKDIDTAEDYFQKALKMKEKKPAATAE